MTPAVVMAASAPAWRLDRDGEGIVLRLSGDWVAREMGLQSRTELQKIAAIAKPAGRLRVDTRRVG